MKCNTLAREEEVRRFPSWYIDRTSRQTGSCLSQIARVTKGALPVQEFCCYLAGFSHLQEAEVARCESMVTECEVHDILKQVGLNKSLGLPYEVYLRLLYLFVLLTDMFNHWLAQVAIPGSVKSQGCDYIAEERWQACFGGLRRLQDHNSAKQS